MKNVGAKISAFVVIFGVFLVIATIVIWCIYNASLNGFIDWFYTYKYAIISMAGTLCIIWGVMGWTLSSMDPD